MENNFTVKPLSTAIRSQVRILEEAGRSQWVRATIVPNRISILMVIYKWRESGAFRLSRISTMGPL